MLDKILRRFPDCENGDIPCLTKRAETIFFVYDEPVNQGRCYAHTNSDGLIQFTVENTSGSPIYFLAVDHCILSDSDPKKCDFILFDDLTLCFVEIKTATMRQRKPQRRRAKEQLIEFIKYFREHLPLADEQIEAYICVLSEAEGRPLNRASLLDEVEEFDLIGATLYHQNSKRFT
jgi:hypothetical protein